MIEGEIISDLPVAGTAAMAEVRLIDAAMVDAPARTLARARFACGQPGARRLPFRLTATVLPQSRYGLTAEIRLAGGERLRPGDLATTRWYGWSVAENRPVSLKVERID